jgi:conjugal transfer ATP-binding protein TraC
MSNNIIDAVTQAVNSLVSALKLPDESAKANDTLGSMNFPSSAVFCPIRIMIPRPGCLLITKPSVLCLRRVLYPVRIKVSSPHWSIYCAANFWGVPVSFHLVSSKLVGNDIDYGLREFRWSGKQAKV